MTFVKYRPTVKRRPGFHTLFNEIINSGLNNVISHQGVNNRPAANVIETKDQYELALAVPGLSKKEFNIDIEKDILTISAQKEAKEDKATIAYTQKEFSFTNFKRAFELPETVDTTAIKANYKNGVLSLVLPKKEEAIAQGPKTIDVK